MKPGPNRMRANARALAILLFLSAFTIVLTIVLGRGGFVFAGVVAGIAACKVRVVSRDFLGLRRGQAAMFAAINGWALILLMIALAQRFAPS